MADNTENDLLPMEFPPTEWQDVAPEGWQETGAAQLTDDSYLVDDDFTPQWEQAMQAQELGTDFTQPDDNGLASDEQGAEEPVREFTAQDMDTDFTQEPDFDSDDNGLTFERLPDEEPQVAQDEGILPMTEEPSIQDQVLAEKPDPRRMAVEAAALEEAKNQKAAQRVQEEIDNLRISEADALRDKEKVEYMVGMERNRQSLERQNLIEESRKLGTDHWWKNASTSQKIGAGMAAIFGGMLSVFNGGRNMGLEVVLKAIDDDLEQQHFDIQNRRGLLGEEAAGLQDRLAASDNSYRTKIAAQQAAYQQVKERIMSEMVTMDPRGSAFSAMRQSLFQVDMALAKADQAAVKNAYDRAVKSRELEQKAEDQKIEREKVKAENYRARLKAQTDIRGQDVTQRGQDLATIRFLQGLDKDRMKAASELAEKGDVEAAKNVAENGIANVYAIDKDGNRHDVLLKPGMEHQSLVMKSLAGRKMIQKSIKRLRDLYNRPGGDVEWWDAMQDAERAELLTDYGALKGMRQMTKEEMSVAASASGKPGSMSGWFVSELRKNPKALDQLSKIADDQVLESLAASVQPQYSGMTYEFDDTKLSPSGRTGLPEPEALEGVNFAPGTTTLNAPFRSPNKPVPVGSWWEDENDKGRMAALFAISKDIDKTKGKGVVHLERGLYDSRNFNRRIAADALGRIKGDGKTVGDPDTVRYLDELAESDPDAEVRKTAAKSANKIRESYKEDFKKREEKVKNNLGPILPPSPADIGASRGASVGVKLDVPTLTKEDVERKKVETLDYMGKSRVK